MKAKPETKVSTATWKRHVPRYRFIGKHSLGYEHGKVYDLVVRETTWLERLLVGYPRNWRVVIAHPTFCPYTSWDSFYKNWEEVTEGGDSDALRSTQNL